MEIDSGLLMFIGVALLPAGLLLFRLVAGLLGRRQMESVGQDIARAAHEEEMREERAVVDKAKAELGRRSVELSGVASLRDHDKRSEELSRLAQRKGRSDR